MNCFKVLLLLGISCMVLSCKDDKNESPQPATEYGSVVVSIKNEIDGQLIQSGSLIYTNEAGNLYSVDDLRYYLSNFILVKSDGSEFKAPNYELIIENIPGSKNFLISGIPVGDYESIKFQLGVDSTKNFSGANSGDLDPVNGMYWDWSSGYVFFKHEGTFVDSMGITNPLTFHYGTLKALYSEELPAVMEVGGAPEIVTMTFNLNKIYRSPNMMNFNGENIHQSNGPNDNLWLQQLKQNFAGSFSVTSIN